MSLCKLPPIYRLSGQLIFPALTPVELGRDQILQGCAVEQLLKGPTGRHVADDQHARPLPAQAQIREKTSDAGNRLPPALATGVRCIKIAPAVTVQLVGRLPVQGAVVALAQ